MQLSDRALKELEHIKKQLAENPDDEVEPTANFDRLSSEEREHVMKEYERMGGK